jgi:hypothetical protein
MTRLLLALLAAVACSRIPPRTPPPPNASFTFDIRDTKGQLIPARITLVAVGGTPQLGLSRSDAGELRGRTLLSGDKIMTLDGTGIIGVPQGTYDIYVSRGIEWSLVHVPRVAIGPAGYALHAKLDHVIDTTGWVSGDFHVHASPSWDSRVPLAHRVIEFVTSGVDVIVSTDHNMIADYAPVITALGAETYIDSIIGNEITTRRRGHFGAYPLPAAAVGRRYGSEWRWRGDATDIFPAVRRDFPGALIQVNHPRRRNWMGYFLDEHFDPATGRALAGFSLDFDTIEVFNGRDSRSPVEVVLKDWFSLLDRGFVATAMGNSDTHDIRSSLGGYPRNFIRVRDDRAGAFAVDDIVGALRARRSFFTTGPMVSMRSGEADVGDVVTTSDGNVKLSIEVTAAPWIAVDSATLYVNGKVAMQWTIEPTELPQRLEVECQVTVTEDSYVVLRADGSEPLWPVGGDDDKHPIVPMAVTNPLFIDRDGDGKYVR